MLKWEDDLKLDASELYIDSRRSRALCFVSHAHSDHIACHEHAICTPETAALVEARVGVGQVTALQFAQSHRFDDRTQIEVLPSGHILGSAMLHVTRDDGTFLYTGDFKLRQCLTVPCSQIRAADTLLMETTYGLPIFRFPPRDLVINQLLDLVEQSFRDNRQPIVMGYSLGKAQEIVRILTRAGYNVTCHGAVHHVNQTYEKFGVDLGKYRRYFFEDFHGPQAIDLRERGVLVAPPQVARSGFATRFANPCRIIMTGWAMLKGAIYRYGVEHALPLSDHADFDELLELVEKVAPKRVYTHHGYREFADTLRARGIDARPAKKDPQMTLFDD
jgi:Cft2 family RNA processing exonuclease